MMFDLLSNIFLADLGKNTIVHISLAHVIFIVTLTGTKVLPLILTSEGNNVMLEAVVAVEGLKSIQVVVSNKPTAQVDILVAGTVQAVDVLTCLNDIGNNQCFLTFGQGSQCHFVFLYFSVNTSIVSEFGFIVKLH